MYKEKVVALMKKAKDDSLIIDGVGEMINTFTNYVNSVVMYAIQMDFLHASYDFEQSRYLMEKYDTDRHMKHEAAIASVNMFNRFCDLYGVEHLTDVDTTNRTAVADFVGNFIIEIYRGEIGKGGMDQAVAEADGKTYDTISASELV